MSRALTGPNVLTAIRIVVVPVFGWMLIAHGAQPGWRLVTTLVFALAIATDFIDGWWARAHDLVSDFGKIADPIADKALTGMAFVGLSIIGELWWWITIVILLREWGITVFRMVLLRRGVVLAASRGGKIKTVLQSVALILFLLPLVPYAGGVPRVAELPDLLAWIVMLLAALQTVVTGVQYVVDNLNR